MPCKVCDENNEIFTYCREHFVDLWWKGEAEKDNKQLAGMPEVDLRAKNIGDWTFSICVIMSDPDYLSKSKKFVVKKLTKGKVYGSVEAPNTGMGHTYIRFASPKLSGTTRDQMSFGVVSSGLSSPDDEAGINQLYAELAMDYVINDQQKDAVCETISKWLAGHLMNDAEYRYGIMTSNCTKFAADCAEAAGVHFCGNRMPSYNRTAGWNLTYTPVKLFGAMSKSLYSYDPRRDQAPGVCPSGAMGFQRSKRSRGGGGGQYEFRKSLEQFKSDTGVKNENDALQLMAMVSKGVIERSDLVEVVKHRPPKDVLKALQQID